MNTTIVVGIIAGVLAVSLGIPAVLASVLGPGWAQVTGFSAESKDDTSAKLTLTASGEIPKKPDDFVNGNVVAGFAWTDLDTGKVFATMIHPVLGRDSHQNPDAWHAHTATLTGGVSTDFCATLIDSTPTAGISIKGSSMSINVDVDKLPFAPEDIDGAVGFVINPSGDCTSGLGVDVVTP